MTKEYHIWDAVFIPECREFVVQPDQASGSELLALRQRLQNDLARYADYFCDLLGSHGVSITADITPAYAGLGPEHLTRIYEDFERRGVDCKFIFLMRDPVERCWSATRMKKSVESDLYGKRPDEEILPTYFKTTDARFRTDYRQTIMALDAAVPSENVYYGIYEEMMQPEQIEALSRFIGIKPDPKFSGRIFNAFPKTEVISMATRRAVAAEYRHVYEFCAVRFPRTRTLWNSMDSV